MSNPFSDIEMAELMGDDVQPIQRVVPRCKRTVGNDGKSLQCELRQLHNGLHKSANGNVTWNDVEEDEKSDS